MGMIAILAVFAVHDQSGVKAQVQPPEGTALQDHWCWKQRVCRGIAEEGICRAVGNLCKSFNCGASHLYDGCEWSYVWACYPSCDEVCTYIKPEEWGWDCGPSCRWTSYNDCSCACADLGVTTFEAGYYKQCE
jgi:hypothetical protein